MERNPRQSEPDVANEERIANLEDEIVRLRQELEVSRTRNTKPDEQLSSPASFSELADSIRYPTLTSSKEFTLGNGTGTRRFELHSTVIGEAEIDDSEFGRFIICLPDCEAFSDIALIAVAEDVTMLRIQMILFAVSMGIPRDYATSLCAFIFLGKSRFEEAYQLTCQIANLPMRRSLCHQAVKNYPNLKYQTKQQFLELASKAR